ncbi:MAG: universal stress protein [Polyangiaceae bacterium]|nr:universal stress protein [Polyangiaceae bacterium]
MISAACPGSLPSTPPPSLPVLLKRGRHLHLARELPASLILVGTHGRTGLARAFTGSVAERVVPRPHRALHRIRRVTGLRGDSRKTCSPESAEAMMTVDAAAVASPHEPTSGARASSILRASSS